MKISLMLQLSFITMLVVLLLINSPVYGHCLGDQKALLLKLKNGLTFDSSLSTKLVRWDQNTDCCQWPGVSCDQKGHVLVLELDNEAIFSGLENPTSLFDLQYLEKLNLAYNHLNSVQIPREVYKLTNLTYLNLSFAGFGGKIPMELSRLTKLTFLDLSNVALKLESGDLKALVGNLPNLRELYLDEVYISWKGIEWCSTLSSSLPQLRVLSMTNCGISSPFDPILLNLHFLSVIRLDDNNLSTIVPEFLANFTKLTTLSLSNCNLRGEFPNKIFQVPTLQEPDLYGNEKLTGTLPDFSQNGSLRELGLGRTNFTGSLPDSIANLTTLTEIDLSSCNFFGPISSKMENLRDLVYLDFSFNSFTGSIPLFHKAKKLNYINLSHNNLTGPLSSTHFGGLSELEYLHLEENYIGGTLPTVVFSIPSLQVLELQNNHFSGEVHEFANASSSFLYELDLSNNYLNGSIPRSIFKLNRLSQLLLSSNSFRGTINIEAIKGLPRLKILDLSYNNLRIDVQGSNSTSFPFPQMSELNLASCQLQKFPDLKNQSLIFALDLSYNRIKGNIPIVPTSLIYLSIANNKLTGSIPSSICNLYQLQFLDMSNNSINNKLPPCLFQMFDYLSVLNLGRNRLSGIILDTFLSNCSLKTLDLSNNNLEGKVPRSLQRCAFLEVLDIGNNKIRDTFPCMLKTLPSLHILVLRSNKFYGDLQCRIANQTWSKLQIIDIASNNFRGALLPHYFSNLEGMMKSRNPEPRLHYLEVEFINYGLYYRNRVTLTLKGQEMEIENILEVFTSIDFSCNNFEGEIPEVLGDLKLLYLLNFSHNALTGRIPKALGKLSQLGSLDLSVNQLSGRIPDELASLTFLAFLNLSFNQLSGRIPRGNQLQTFSAESFEGNTGLCDFPLKKLCSDTKMNGSSQPRSHSDDETVDGKYISFALGSSLCFGIVTWLLLHSTRYNELVDRLLFRIFGEHKKAGRNRNRRRSR
ncbi:receptor-like protein 12 [Solanum tuberosum]|uniref:receptor-like protein 12 n=1 Tax=Solanum tuberosum TaxID=4113 RepID=UPI00073A43C6|nr:PREDICTED: receptor-like protein 12 [Solanum tuberosum]